jgi:competence protein ComEC
MKLKILLAICLVALGIGWWFSQPDGKVRVIFCDVGQGDGILVQKGMSQMIIDTGPPNNKMGECLGKYMPFWDKKIEVIIISHWDKDHSGGLVDIEKYYKVEKLYSGKESPDKNEQNIYSSDLADGEMIKMGEIEFDVISTKGVEGKGVDLENGESVIGVLSYRINRFLMMGDVTAEVENRMVWRNELMGKIDVLKVSHHGSGTATSEELLEAVKPMEAVISVGKNTFGHPSPEVIKRLEEKGIKIRRTDQEGNIVYEIY